MTNDAVNETFHEAYAAARDARERDAPVLVLLGDELVAHWKGRRAHVVRPRSFHAIKAISHAPVALYALLRAGRDAAGLRDCLASADLDEVPAGAPRDDCAETLRLTRVAMDGGELPRALGPLLYRLTVHATEIHLDALDHAVNGELARLDARERSRLQVVVTGDHQARRRSLGMQYFAKRLPQGDPAGERVLYAEGVTDEKAALDLVALQRLDREVAEVFFGDPSRLQSDVLGEAAAEVLGRSPLAPIDGI